MKTLYSGLSSEAVERSRREHGENKFKKTKNKGIIGRFFENLSDPIIKILMIALVVEVVITLGKCNYLEIVGIVAAILIATIVSTLSEYGSEKAFERLESASEGKINVYRDGSLTELNAENLVVGDIVVLTSGERVPADMEIIDGKIMVDQSALNGESIEVEKTKSQITNEWNLSEKGLIFSGSQITSGRCIARVGRVGEASYYGMVAHDVQARTRISPLKLRLTKLAKQISILGYIMAAIVGLLYLFNCFVIKNAYDPVRIKNALCDIPYVATTLVKAFTMMITVVVVAVPEGLPMMITVVLSANTKRMLRDGILVKKLIGIETAGSLNILFTDKTGTLTTGNLCLDRIVTERGVYTSPKALMDHDAIYKAMVLTAKYNTDCRMVGDDIIGGNSTDRAVFDFFKQHEIKADVVERTEFSSERKYSDILLKNGEKYIKGAAETTLGRCCDMLGDDGEVYPSELSFVKKEYLKATERGERVLCVSKSNKDSSDMIFVALLVLKDKIRTDVKDAIKCVQRAGVQIVMLTGDNKKTAMAIAEECGFYKSGMGQIAITSDEMRNLDDDALKLLIPKLCIVARALPTDKTRLVKLSQELELVAGMTGDGINDAPSLKLADVGFAMGSGTEIAKEAGDIVVLNNSFLSIVKTILYGRTIFKSIRKFITFQLIMNLAACGITLIGQILGIENPITIIQMLWINIIMDTLGGLAFAGEAPLEYYMKDKPKRRDEPIIDKVMLGHILLNGAFTLALLVCFLKLDFYQNAFAKDSMKHMGAFYALFIFCGLFNFISARSERLLLFSNITKNKPFLFVLALITVIQLFIIYFGGSFFRSVPLSCKELFLVVETAFSVLVFDTIRRLFVKLK